MELIITSGHPSSLLDIYFPLDIKNHWNFADVWLKFLWVSFSTNLIAKMSFLGKVNRQKFTDKSMESMFKTHFRATKLLPFWLKPNGTEII